MKKFDLKYEKIYALDYRRTKEEFPNESEEFLEKEARKRAEEDSRFILKLEIARKYQETDGFSQDYAKKIAQEMIDELPFELFPNIIEWINNEPISEIDYGGLSIKKMMNWRMYPFSQYIKAMLIYINSGCCKPNIWKNYLLGNPIVYFKNNAMHIEEK